MKKPLVLLAAFSGLLVIPAANAQILVNDNFNRPDGSLVGTSPTPGPGGVWTSHSGTLGDLLLSGGLAVVQHGVPSEDANVPFAVQTAGLLSANFDISVTSSGLITGGDYEYFAHFSDGGTSAFFARVDVVEATGGGDYSLGIATTSGTAEAVLPVDFSFGNTVNLTLTYNFGTGLSSLTVGANTIFSTTSVISPGLSAFALRQSDSSLNEAIMVDNLVVSIVPEPSVAALGLLGAAGLALARRRTA